MNLFSQSKLTLKLKKQNNTTSTGLTNKCQETEITELLPDNSILSENDSFVEVLHSDQSNKEKLTTSQSVFKTTFSDQNTTNTVNESKQCPVCLQMLDVKKFIPHVKSCGTSHNLSSKVLIEAVDLQERQAAEREALGLPILTRNLEVNKKKKGKVNKQTKLKIGSDSNLDLAIAMSVSLQESKNAEIIKESETLLEAGLEKEALEKRKTLENFGFVSNQPVKFKPKNDSKINSLLFKQTKEDREKRITEKVAMILIDVDTDASSSELLSNDCLNTKLVSKYLNAIRNIDNELWKKSLLEEENICAFYVKQLSKFIKPCESNNIIGLKNDFRLSSHQNTLKHESIMNNEEFVDKLQLAVDNSNIDNIISTSHNIIANKTILEFSSKWKSMIGNQFMSDITIYAKDEHEIPAHSLVFYVQYPDILDDVVTEKSDICKSKKMLMWMEYSYEACLAFLELIYSGQESIIKPEFREDYLHLGTRYNILMAVNDNEKHGWFSKDDDKLSKRKNTEFYSNLNNCKRYKASSPDMFMSDDISVEACLNDNFLGTTVNDEKSLSLLKTKQWLYSQHHKSSFTDNLKINIPEKSSCHSFHSATTVSLKCSSSSNSDSENNDEPIEVSTDRNTLSKSKLLSMYESSVKNVSKLQNNKNVAGSLINSVTEISKLTKLSRKEPDLITINSDSENGSIDIIFCNDITKSSHNNTFLSQSNTKNEKNNRSFNSSNAKYGNYINTIELNDNSSDSIHSACTNILYQKNHNSLFSNSLFDNSVLNLKNKLINIDDGSSKRIFSSNNDVIDLIEDSSDSIYTIDLMSRKKNSIITVPASINNALNSSTSFSTVTNSKETIPVSQSDSTTQYEINNLSSFSRSTLLSFSKSNESNFIKSNEKTSDNFNFNSSDSSNISKNKDDSKLLSKSQVQISLVDNLPSTSSNTNCHFKMNDIEENDNINRIFSNESENTLKKCNLDSKLLKNISTTSLILSNNDYDDSSVNTKEVDSTFLPSRESINKHLIHTDCPQGDCDLNQLSEVTSSNKNDYKLNESNIEQIIDDPWMDYNDWQAVNLSPQQVSPILSKSMSLVLVDECDVQTPKKKNLNRIHLLTPTSVSSPDNISFLKKNSLTPNKYSSRISTPKSLRRVQSESVIGSKQQITPLPDYSSMKTPDLRKEFDRYGLKDLGRRKGKLILRHIYDVLHPLFPSEEDNCNTEFEQYSSSSDISEHGIPDYDGSCDDIETYNPSNLSHKISVETGFKQLLKTNEDLHKKILCYEPIWIEELKEDLKQHNVNISMQKLMTFLDDKCVTFRSKSLNDQRQKTLSKKSSKRKKLF